MVDLFSGMLTGPAQGFVPKGAPVNGLVFSNPDIDEPVDDPPDSDGGPQCEVCGRDVPLTPTGRVPKHPRCQDHKSRTRETAGDTGSGVRRTAAVDKAHQARLDNITGDLMEGIGKLSGTIVAVAPVTSGTIAIQGPPAVSALVRLADGHPRFLDGLEAVAKTVPFVAIGEFVAAVMLAVAVDLGRANPYGFAGETLKVAEAAEKMGWQPPEQKQQQAAIVDPSVPPPPRFKL